ncbi:tetratricopeptide repeat protein [Pseudoduganella chitinolytica]|uniref:Tetratricopeptide repeat protein n=1 Tax=Pseudoduganella chitinolytica TaxID=34070 RepID=A0ABY8B8J7_9BURK|nr:tetratricopeptide repeat protein [Pseudoduganella chitinolytica]WEF31318.1 tetratricopeptide repeat protein [Pseudoduganella chitinolytica]
MKYPSLPPPCRHVLAACLALCLALLLTACASPPRVQAPPPALFADALFQPAVALPTEAQIFALTPAMRAYTQAVSRDRRGKEIRRALFDALYRRDQLQLEYDSALTRTAAEAFEARQGNCLSLVIMTAALAEELDIPVVLQSVPTEDSWSRSGEIYFNSGHVNLKLGRIQRETPGGYDADAYTVIDFLPPPEGRQREGIPIGRHTVVAMFMNNRAAEALARGRLVEAYWWARGAVQADPNLLYVYNTLAVVYRRHGNLPQAEHTLRYALGRDPRNAMALSNLAQVVENQGRGDEAAVLKAQLARLQPEQPFRYFNQGREAMQAGDYRRARELFQRELRRDGTYHEFHFWLAAAHYLLGDMAAAEKHMRLAKNASTTRKDHELYAAKLDRLKSRQH